MSATGTGPNRPKELHPANSTSRRRVWGLWLFFIYLLFYGGFMGLSAFATRLIGAPVFAGVNLAIFYGVGLILAAILLAVIYMFVGRNDGEEDGAAREMER